MVVVKEVSAKTILDSRGEKTIFILIKTNIGEFSASSPNGKSKGKFEAKPYKINLQEDIESIKKIKDYFSEEVLEKFDDLRRIEDITEGHIGANTLFALESAILKAIAKEKKKQVWQIVDEKAKNFPRLVGNCVEGGKHSKYSANKKPDFQEFLLIPDDKLNYSFELNKKLREKVKEEFSKNDENFSSEIGDENGWLTSKNEKEILEILKKLKVRTGIDVAASTFYRRKKYFYENPKLDRDSQEQLFYLKNLIKNFSIFYVEDPFDEEDFESFAKLLKIFPNILVVGDDLTVTNFNRLKKAIEIKSINAIIVKPNQCGSLINVRRVCDLAKENKIKIVFSHRSGETEENILADLAFGFQADFFKCGIIGKEREAKLKRLIEIEKSLK